MVSSVPYCGHLSIYLASPNTRSKMHRSTWRFRNVCSQSVRNVAHRPVVLAQQTRSLGLADSAIDAHILAVQRSLRIFAF